MLNKTATRIAATLIGVAPLVGTAQAESLIVGNFGIPIPMMKDVASDAYSEAMGFDIEWRKFASGDVKLAALGSSPFAIAASQGVPIELFSIGAVIGEAESRIARDGSGIETLEDLKGKRVAVPVGSTAHFSLVGALAHAGIAEKELTILSMPPDQIAAAWEQSAIDAAFIWEPVQSQILQSGTRILGANETAEWGYPTFDGWVVNAEWAEENPEALAAFVKLSDEANLAYLADPAAWTPDSAPVLAIAEATGADPEQVPVILSGFTFLPAADQAGEAWLGGPMAPAIKATSEFLKEAGRIDMVADDYSQFITLKPLEDATAQ
ncbi:taurine ABC transporter substrate-binding protein [Tropicimonas aquimaris]|uniref:ABC transporter substrate-binding protein n=1 Tax=Tropicimonas aquimaris TaxID=914152 RepID=A0ABW3IRT0_9RHOB